MSTRATYQFNKHYGTNVTCYIHHDGYPSGAAYYFLRALRHQTADKAPNETLAEKFVRANDRAELTDSHRSHGDTDYRYTYECRSRTLLVEKRNNCLDPTFVAIFHGRIEEFINEHPEPFCSQLFGDGQFVPLEVLELAK